MFKVRKGTKFSETGKVAKALGVSKTFVSMVLHGRGRSQRIADYLFTHYNIILKGYTYEEADKEKVQQR